ncbi:MAG: hypothetical protein KKB79_00220 [Nanoarchaeota archaeon]|nr:hypothetical protein [Nanoarchaeota archaeon]
MKHRTTIQVDRSLLDSLNEIKEHPRQTYDELIRHLICVLKSVRDKNQYDEFLHKIQQEKMKELWDNEDDEAWNNA